MMANPHELVEGVIIASYAIRASTAFIYVRGEVVHVIRRLQAGRRRRPTRPGTSARTSTAAASTSTSSCTPAPAPTSAARRRRCSTRSRATAASRGCARRSRRRTASTRCPTVVNNVESIASRAEPSCSAAPSGSPRMGTEKSKGYTLYSLSGHVKRPGQYEAPLGITLRQLLDLAGGMREGHELKFWTPGGSSHAAAHRRAPRRPARLRGRRRGRLDARHQGAAVLRRDHLRRALRCCAGPSSTPTSPAASARPAARAPTGWCRSCSGSRPAPAPRRTSTRCSTPATTSSAARSAPSATARPARSSRASQLLPRRVRRRTSPRRLPVRPGGLHRLRRHSRPPQEPAHDRHLPPTRPSSPDGRPRHA